MNAIRTDRHIGPVQAGRSQRTSSMIDEAESAELQHPKPSPIPLPIVTFWSAVALLAAGCVVVYVCSTMTGHFAIVAYIATFFCCSWVAVLSGILTGVFVLAKRCSVVQLVLQLPVFGYCVYFLSQFL